MTLHPTEERLNDYVDGLLSGGEVEVLERHLEGCAACRAEVEGVRSLLARVAELPRDISPPPGVWEAVRDETLDRPAGRWEALWRVRYGLAAAAVLLVALSSTATVVLVGGGGSDPVPLVQAPAPVAGPEALASLASFREAEAEYVRTAADLQAVLDARREQLAPETVQVLEENLRIMDGAIREARAALEADPASTELPHVLSSTYQEKINVLERAVRLSAQT